MICKGQTPFYSSFSLASVLLHANWQMAGDQQIPSQGLHNFDREAARGAPVMNLLGMKENTTIVGVQVLRVFLVKAGAGCYRVCLNQKWQNSCRFWTFICRSSRTIWGVRSQVRQIIPYLPPTSVAIMYAHTYRYSHLPTCVQNPPILSSSQRMTLQVFCPGREDELGKKPKFDRRHIDKLFPRSPPETSLIMY